MNCDDIGSIGKAIHAQKCLSQNSDLISSVLRVRRVFLKCLFATKLCKHAVGVKGEVFGAHREVDKPAASVLQEVQRSARPIDEGFASYDRSVFVLVHVDHGEIGSFRSIVVHCTKQETGEGIKIKPGI
jgi:hypothetical protein